MTCTRFDDEALLALQTGEPLDPHFDECADCLRARREHDALARTLAMGDAALAPSVRWEEALFERIDRRDRTAPGSTPGVYSAIGVIVTDALDGSDSDLLEALRSGDRSARQRLFFRYLPAIRRFFRNKAGAEQADELVSQTLLQCDKHVDGALATTSFRAFLFGVARNTLIHHLRSGVAPSALDPHDLSVKDLYPEGEFSFQGSPEANAFAAALRSIPLRDQELLELFFFEELTVPEVAQVLDIPEPTVRSRLLRATEQLRELLGESAPSSGSDDPASDKATWRLVSDALSRTSPKAG